MAERRSILSARVDDIPLLLAQLARLGVRSLLDEYFPAHGNWVGLSLGWVCESCCSCSRNCWTIASNAATLASSARM